ncbi:acyl carrier protein [Actinoplanes siamensis]|uniref:Uncharacterized protein n=1 Tax=Actinoplanes siamensis TaxID=1223317 RepID=A0A919NBV1_9ACTN|nr:acyl carrier protein [Actinoplanes siamensis]GIF08231.1 hypothetical protein Asi03nite_57690 [Actinoplanes siamensis]
MTDRPIRDLVVEVLRQCSGATEAEITGARNLYDDGVLTSLSLAYVVVELESRLGLALMDDLHVPEWTSVDSITGLLARAGTPASPARLEP